MAEKDRRGKLVSIVLDEASIGRATGDAEHERRVAIYDLLQDNLFELTGETAAEYGLNLSIQERKLVFAVSDKNGALLQTHILSLTPFRERVKDYLLICESYYQAIRSSGLRQIEAIDMGRRGLHDEGARLLLDRLAGKIVIDMNTARRLFTLLCALYAKV